MNSTDDTERKEFEKRLRHMPNGCIEWIGTIDGTGYGIFTFKRKRSLAHRASWKLFRGAIPVGMCVLHRCDNPPCVNPEHLFIGDRGDNARDMATKGRQWVQQNPKGRPVCPPELKARGEKHGMSKLTESDVLSIRLRASRGDLGKHIAVDFGCTPNLICEVIHGRIWKHVGGPIRLSNKRKFGASG